VPDSPGPFTTDAADLADGERLVIRLRVPLAALTDPPPPDACPIRVVTASGSIYKFDPHTMTAFRLPDSGAELRRDGEHMHLLS